jgi:FkbM family methyltransferase
LDIGAHYGYTAIALSRLVGLQGRVFAFEPMISTAGYLSQTRMLNRFPQLIVLPFALGMSEEIELRELPTVRGMVDSSIQSGEWFETILLISLDKLWNQICRGQEKIDGIKIDVQGLEIDVIQGMSGVLLRWKPKIVIELHSRVDRKLLLDLLQAAGYLRKGVPIEPVPGEIEPQYVDNRSYSFQVI